MKKFTQISLDERDCVAIAEAVSLLRSHFPVERVMLYGSKARGTDDEQIEDSGEGA